MRLNGGKAAALVLKIFERVGAIGESKYSQMTNYDREEFLLTFLNTILDSAIDVGLDESLDSLQAKWGIDKVGDTPLRKYVTDLLKEELKEMLIVMIDELISSGKDANIVETMKNWVDEGGMARIATEETIKFVGELMQQEAPKGTAAESEALEMRDEDVDLMYRIMDSEGITEQEYKNRMQSLRQKIINQTEIVKKKKMLNWDSMTRDEQDRVYKAYLDEMNSYIKEEASSTFKEEFTDEIVEILSETIVQDKTQETNTESSSRKNENKN